MGTTKYAKPYTTTSIVHGGVTVTGTFAGENKPDGNGAYTLDARLPYIERITSNETGTVTTSDIRINVASRMMQKEALAHAQTAYFVCIVIVQWADLVICKTRMNSIYHQGMLNPAMNYGLIFETLLAAILCYPPGLTFALGTRPLKFVHWMPGVPYSIFIFLYDETHKKIMRHQAREATDKQTGQVIRYPGWVERNTYY